MVNHSLLWTFCAILAIPLVLAATSSSNNDLYGSGGQGSGSGEQDKLQDALSNQGDYSGTVPGNTQAKLSNGQPATVSGNVQVSSGRIAQADSIGYQGASISQAQGFTASGDGYSVDHAGQLVQSGSIIIGGSGIKYSGGRLTADSYDSFTTAGSITTSGQGLDSIANKISVETADTLISGSVSFSNIQDTDFEIFGNAVTAKPANGTIITITDAANNEVEFEATSNSSNITVSKTKPARYILSKGILKNTRGNITEAILGNNTVVVEMGMLGFQCMQISPVGSYYYNEDFRKDFGINVPIENNETYRLCLRKLAGEEFNNTDGTVDYVARKIMATKIINYLRHVFENASLVDLQLKNVYEAKSMDNHVEMQLDREMVLVELLNLSNSMTDYNISVARLGMHEIIETDNSRFEKMQFNEQYPNVIKIYATNYSDTALQVEGKTVTQIGKNKVKLLTVNDEDVDKAELLLINYWIKRWKSLMDYLEG